MVRARDTQLSARRARARSRPSIATTGGMAALLGRPGGARRRGARAGRATRSRWRARSTAAACPASRACRICSRARSPGARRGARTAPTGSLALLNAGDERRATAADLAALGVASLVAPRSRCSDRGAPRSPADALAVSLPPHGARCCRVRGAVPPRRLLRLRRHLLGAGRRRHARARSTRGDVARRCGPATSAERSRAWDYNLEILDGLAAAGGRARGVPAHESSSIPARASWSRGAEARACRSACSPTASTAT